MSCLKELIQEKTVFSMNSYFDISLLNDKSDSKHTSLHAEIVNLTQEDIDLKKALNLGYSLSSVEDWIKQRHSVPINVLNNIDSISPQVKFLNYRGSKIKVKLPELDNNLFYFAGVVFGDGHVSGVIRPKGYRSYRVKIEKSKSDFSQYFISQLIEELFGFKPRIYFWKRKSELVNIIVNSKVVSRILTNVFGFSYGKKSDKVIDFVKQFPEELQLYFITGLLDTDGGISASSFSFCNSSKKTVLFVKDFMEKQNLATKFYEQSKENFKWYQVRIPLKDKNKFLKTFPLKNKRKYAGGGI